MNALIKSQGSAQPRVDGSVSFWGAGLWSAFKLAGRGLLFCLIAPLLPVILLMHLVAIIEPDPIQEVI